jgi:hypothetical protein
MTPKKIVGFENCVLDAGLLHLGLAGLVDPPRWIELERVLADFVTVRRRPNRVHAVLIDLRGATLDPCVTAEFLVEQLRMADPARYRPRTVLLPPPDPQNKAGGGGYTLTQCRFGPRRQAALRGRGASFRFLLMPAWHSPTPRSGRRRSGRS